MTIREDSSSSLSSSPKSSSAGRAGRAAAAPKQNFRAIAEAIVRGHEALCIGIWDPQQPYCSCAPNGSPLCTACAKLATAIEIELLRAGASPGASPGDGKP